MLYAVSGRAACVYLPESCDSVLYAVSGRCLYVHLPESCDSVLYAVSGRAACPCVHFTESCEALRRVRSRCLCTRMFECLCHLILPCLTRSIDFTQSLNRDRPRLAPSRPLPPAACRAACALSRAAHALLSASRTPRTDNGRSTRVGHELPTPSAADAAALVASRALCRL